MKLNRRLIMVLALVMSLAMATTGTLAFLTDRDTVENTFTMGNVDIKVDEEFEQDSPLNPGVEVEKKAGITNTHKTEPAYVWMTVSVPENLDQAVTLKWAEGVTAEKLTESVHDGYVSYLVKHEGPLAAGASTPKYLESVTLSEKVDYQNGKYVLVDGGNVTELGDLSKVDIIVDGFAMQTEGMADVNAAYAAYVAQWSELGNGGDSGYDTTTSVGGEEGMGSALNYSGTVVLDEDVNAGSVTIAEQNKNTIDLNDKTMTGSITNNGELTVTGGTLVSDVAGIVNNGDATLTDVTMNAGSPANYASINVNGSATEYNNFNLDSQGGGIGVDEGAQVIFNSGSVAVNSASTSGRYNFYVVGEGSSLTINDGTFSFSKTLNQKRAYIYAGAGATVTVNGGTFGPASTRSGYTAGILGDGTVVIKGGTFGFDPSNWVAEGYQAVKGEDGNWTVSAL